MSDVPLTAQGGPAVAGPLVLPPDERAALVRRGRALEYITVGYNSLEGVLSIAAGVVAGSIALVGFGIDSGIEVVSGLALIWRLYSDADERKRERVENLALRIVGVSFLLLAAYVTFDSAKSLIEREPPGQSVLGLVIAGFSVILMPMLASAKRKVARRIGSAALEADATQTDLCMYLSAILLVGLGLNAWLGWWWADPLAALVMVPIITKEGWEAVRGETKCGCHGAGG